MKILNSEMLKMIFQLMTPVDPTSVSELQKVINKGCYDVDGAIFLSERYLSSFVSLEDFSDLTGLECFVNSLHIDDFVDDNWIATAIWFYEKTSSLLKSKYPNAFFRFIISCCELSCTVRFHKIRSGEQWICDDVDTYEDEAILILDY